MSKKLAVAALAGFLLAACAHQQPIYNVTAHPLPASAQKLSLAQIERLIVEAGQTRGWKFEPLAPGKLRATQDQPKYAADVDVIYDQKSFSITYVGSRGMKEQGEVIHPHYNSWIHRLEGDIDTRLSNAAVLAK